MGTGHERKLLKNLFKRSREENVFGVKTLIPSNEDMMFISLVNLARNLREKQVRQDSFILYLIASFYKKVNLILIGKLLKKMQD